MLILHNEGYNLNGEAKLAQMQNERDQKNELLRGHCH
jgi:hypothetical protein